MDKGSVTMTGRTEMLAAVDQLPAVVTQALQQVASDTANRERVTAQRLVRVAEHASQTVIPGLTKSTIRVTPDLAHKQYLVEVGPTPEPGRKGHWATFVRDFLAVLIEHGTAFMQARPFMRPANDQERDRYARDMERASADAVAKALK